MYHWKMGWSNIANSKFNTPSSLIPTRFIMIKFEPSHKIYFCHAKGENSIFQFLKSHVLNILT